MTISTTLSRVSYAGDGTTVAFAVPFPFFNADELEVIERVTATGVESAKALATHYTVSGGNGTTGTLTALAAPASTVTWTIRRKTARTQLVDYTPNDPFPADTHERALDRLTALVQELSDDLDRAAKLSPTSALSSLTLPTPSPAKFLRWNATATGLENADAGTGGGGLSVPVSLAQGGTSATTATEARSNLGLGNAAAARASLGFGTAVLSDAGTGPGQLLQIPGSGILPAGIGTGRLLRITQFTQPGTFTYTKPSDINAVIVHVVGGGGGGGGTKGSSTLSGAGSGGGGGGMAVKLMSATSLTSTVTVMVGVGGSAGTSTLPGMTGGSSSFGAFCSATGGAGGVSDTTGSISLYTSIGSAGGMGAGGDFNIAGGPGDGALKLSSVQTGGGAGGSTPYGGGGESTEEPLDGHPGRGYGAGGSGASTAAASGAVALSGGVGAAGAVIIFEYA